GGIERINTYSYDLRGNIKTIYKVELQNGRQTSYSYITLTYETSGWLDKLKSVTINGVTRHISGYDVIGNPRFYMGFEIDYDQRSITKIEEPKTGDIYTYKYNSNNIRFEKSANGIITNYTLEGTRILKETRTDGKVLNYFYDKNGSIIGFKYNSNNYFYIKNLQNDIIGITNSNGNLIVTYVYDAYGNIVSITDTSGVNLGKINPFRFKSYYFDEETKFYYLNSRYYDPLIGRFINADDIGMLASDELNLFKYCDNNPVMHVDPNGNAWWSIALIALTTVVVVNHIVSVVEILIADSKVEDSYTIKEAKAEIEKITGENTVSFNDSNVEIENSKDIHSRYERIIISKIIKNTVNNEGNKLTYRSTYSLSSEWAGHNILALFKIKSERTDNVNLDYDFSTNDRLTKVGTVALEILGWL
ncbi:MAG: RHS repeat-associated core domain-containing protein, partial [Bacilli bacterium]